MNGGLLLPGDNAAPLVLPIPLPTRETLVDHVGIPRSRPQTKIKRHRTGLVVTAVDHIRREIETDVFLVARATAPADAALLHLFGLEVAAPAVLVAQKAGSSDFSDYSGLLEPTGFMPIKCDLRAAVEQDRAAKSIAEPEGRYLLRHLEGTLKDLRTIAPATGCVLRLVSLDNQDNVAAAGNFAVDDWLNMRNFALRAFDARQTAYIEGVLRAPMPAGSSAESAPTVEFIRWSEKPGSGASLQVRIDDRVIFYGRVIDAPVAYEGKKPARVPVAGLPVFGPSGTESKPVVWVSK